MEFDLALALPVGLGHGLGKESVIFIDLMRVYIDFMGIVRSLFGSLSRYPVYFGELAGPREGLGLASKIGLWKLDRNNWWSSKESSGQAVSRGESSSRDYKWCLEEYSSLPRGGK